MVDLLERRGLVAVLVVVAVAGCATGQKRDLLEVHSVRIEGARKVDEGDVKKHILTTENSWVPFSRKQYFDEDAWKTDLRRIEKYYRAQGFYQAKVTREEVKPHGRKEVDVVASVEEGDPTHVGSVDLHGFDDLPQDEGYAAAKVEGEVKVGLDTRVAEVTVDVDHGPRYRFGDVSAKEHTPSRVPPWRVTEQAAADATPGDWYSLKAQRAAEARIF